mgnify:CR=1 FL=1
MEKIVKHEDREERVNVLRLALNSMGIGVNYQTTDLILKTVDKIDSDIDSFSLKDVAKLQVDDESKWNKYFEPPYEHPLAG